MKWWASLLLTLLFGSAAAAWWYLVHPSFFTLSSAAGFAVAVLAMRVFGLGEERSIVKWRVSVTVMLFSFGLPVLLGVLLTSGDSHGILAVLFGQEGPGQRIISFAPCRVRSCR
jgi:hypothetical protein